MFITASKISHKSRVNTIAYSKQTTYIQTIYQSHPETVIMMNVTFTISDALVHKASWVTCQFLNAHLVRRKFYKNAAK